MLYILRYTLYSNDHIILSISTVEVYVSISRYIVSIRDLNIYIYICRAGHDTQKMYNRYNYTLFSYNRYNYNYFKKNNSRYNYKYRIFLVDTS